MTRRGNVREVKDPHPVFQKRERLRMGTQMQVLALRSSGYREEKTR